MIQCFSDRAWERGEEERARMTRLICGPKTDVASPKVRKTIQQTIEFYNLVFPGGVVNFGETKLLTNLTTLWKQFLGQKVVNPELIFASRAELGLYNLLHRLGAKVDTTAILNKVSKMKL